MTLQWLHNIFPSFDSLKRNAYKLKCRYCNMYTEAVGFCIGLQNYNTSVLYWSGVAHTVMIIYRKEFRNAMLCQYSRADKESNTMVAGSYTG